MPTIPVGFGQANLRFTGSALPFGGEITFGFDPTGFPTIDPIVIANFIADEYSPVVMPVATTQITFSECYVKLGPNETGPSGSAFRTVTGTQADATVPPNTCLLVRKTTSGGGRRGRGRLYQPGLAEGTVDQAGRLLPGTHNAWQVAFGTFFTGLTGGSIQPVVLHSPGLSTEPAPTEILAFDVQPLCGTQRDRMRR